MPRRKKTAANDRLRAMAGVASKFTAWKPATEVLTPVESVPTIFPQINVATQVGGWPLQRIALIHGPSNHGKTLLAHGLGLSFLKSDNFYQLIDAEYTTDRKWLRRLMGDYVDHPGFIAKRPRSYEETVDAVSTSVSEIAKARATGDLPPDVTSLICVDSIKKLVPQRLLKEIAKQNAEKDGNIDGMKGRAAMYKAALNGAWMDQLVPELYHTKTTLLLIGRESENTEATGMYDPDWKLTGGKQIVYDSSLIARITRASYVKVGSKDKAKVVGERHRVAIHKTKVGGKDDKTTTCYFHSSNGTRSPFGFDRARDLIEMALDCGAIVQKGSSYTMTSTGEFWRGAHRIATSLNESPPTMDLLEQDIKERYDVSKMEEQDASDDE